METRALGWFSLHQALQSFQGCSCLFTGGKTQAQSSLGLPSSCREKVWSWDLGTGLPPLVASGASARRELSSAVVATREQSRVLCELREVRRPDWLPKQFRGIAGPCFPGQS